MGTEEQMVLSNGLREGVGPLWEKVVAHPFVIELGEGALPPEIFNVYFDQDYLFLKDWAILLSLATAKAPDFDAARELVRFLHLGLGGEEGLFQQAFRERGLSRQNVADLEYLPTTLHYSGYLRKIAYEGSFIEVVTTILAVEWPYLEWAQRLERAGKRPDNHYYQTWIDIHTSQGMQDFVGWLRQIVDEAGVAREEQSHLHRIFRDVLRYEFLFFEMAYRGEQWPD
jgi:thiaminase (transcriptional activator TenA)